MKLLRFTLAASLISALFYSATMASAAITLPSKLTTPPAGTNVKIFVVNPNTGAGLLQGASFSRRENEGFGAPTTINPDGTLYYTFGAGSWYFDLALPNDGGMNREQFHVVVASNGTVTVSNSTLDPNGYFIVVASRLPAPSTSHPPGQPWTLPNGYQTWADKPTVNYLLPIFKNVLPMPILAVLKAYLQQVLMESKSPEFSLGVPNLCKEW